MQDQVRAVTGSEVERVPSPGGACWMCGLPAACRGEAHWQAAQGQGAVPDARRRYRPVDELFAEISAIGGTDAHMIRLGTALMPGEARDLQENIRAQNRLRSRETMVHAVITQILLDWYATASGQTHSEVLQRLALKGSG